ncbi:CoA pyrophosphatase [Candidatus Macondimonas diazotrophica]|uniref:CoA pyrophosphatase n=2 Tax=Candidatus Macondimonas diazotrophica TaxID=2305248 RepID=A0A4Z0FA01_9GAMM|nr:CoA pyrophosphatase [Candidatus Macondimonas diazotrophica]
MAAGLNGHIATYLGLAPRSGPALKMMRASQAESMKEPILDDIISRLANSLPAPAPACLHEFPGPLNLPLDLLPVPLERLRAASVLVPIVRDPAGSRILLTQRTAHLRHHGGQISFPGGGAEPEDVDAIQTALRESAEELGLPSDQVHVIGYLDPHVTVSGFCITPVVGFVPPDLSLQPDPNEVSEVFEVPLTFLMDPANHQRRTVQIKDRELTYHTIVYGPWNIWGATAAMIINLAEKLALVPPEGA